jgi:hypothetical protein
MLSNHLSELAIAQWGAGQSEEVKRALGVENGVTPHQSTIQRLFRRLNVEEVEAAFRGITLSFLQPAQAARGNCGVAIDGHAQRGRLPFEEQQSYPIHAVSLLDHQTGIVLTQGHVQAPDVQAPVEEKQLATKKALSDEEEQEEKKARSELAVAARLLPLIDWRGKVLTGDALYCQRTLCSALREAGGDYLFLVKGNQPRLLEDLHLLFAPVPAPTRKGSCGYHSKRRTQRRKVMDVWSCEAFGYLANSKTIPIGPDSNKFLRSAVAFNPKASAHKRSAMGSPVYLLSLPFLRPCSPSNEAIGALKTRFIMSET